MTDAVTNVARSPLDDPDPRPARRLRVLHVMEAVGGGTFRHLDDLVRSADVEHHVACPLSRRTDLSHPDPTGVLAASGARIHPVAMSRRVLDPANVAALLALRRLVARIRPDVIHAHASVAGAVARLAAPAGVPLVWSPHAVHDKKWVLRVERRLTRLTSVVVTLSPSEQRAALAAGVARADRVRLIPNGISLGTAGTATTSKRDLGLPPDARVLGFVGRLSEQKAPLDFVAAARLVLEAEPDVHAVCIGSGPLEDVVVAAGAALPAGRFHHVVLDEGAARVLPAFDVLLTPSVYEGGPYLPLEAMAAGVPVVASDCSGLRDYVVHGVSGLTVAVGDVPGYAQAVLELLRDAGLREGLKASARVHVEREHDLARMGRAYEELYRELAQVTDAPA